MELQKVMENMGLEKKPAFGAEAKGSEPLAGFVSASKPEPEDTIKSVESELRDLNMNKETGTFTIEGWEAVITPLPEQAARFARVLTHGELRSLLSAFKESSWTPPLVAKILKVYVIAKRSAAHLEMLKAKHASQRGGSMENLTEKDPGAQPSLVCSNCNAPWGSFATCMLCKRTSPIDMSTTPLSVIEVDGQTWQLRFSDSGPTWVLSGAKATKEAGYIEVGDLGRPPPAVASGADPGLVSFSEQVAESQRVTLRQPIETFGKDDIFHPKGERPPALEEQDETQSAVIFHPKAIQVVKFKANLLSTEAADMEAVTQERKRQKLEEQHARESQAAGLRKLDLQQFRAFLKRKHEESGVTTSYEAILAAQTTQDQAAQTGKLSSNPSRWTPSRSGRRTCSVHGKGIFCPLTGPGRPRAVRLQRLEDDLPRDERLSHRQQMSHFGPSPFARVSNYPVGHLHIRRRDWNDSCWKIGPPPSWGKRGEEICSAGLHPQLPHGRGPSLGWRLGTENVSSQCPARTPLLGDPHWTFGEHLLRTADLHGWTKGSALGFGRSCPWHWPNLSGGSSRGTSPQWSPSWGTPGPSRRSTRFGHWRPCSSSPHAVALGKASSRRRRPSWQRTSPRRPRSSPSLRAWALDTPRPRQRWSCCTRSWVRDRWIFRCSFCCSNKSNYWLILAPYGIK